MRLSAIAADIIGTLLDEKRECYLRELARKTKRSTSSISRQLEELRESGVLVERKSGKELMVCLDTGNALTLKLCELIEVERAELFRARHAEMGIVLDDFMDLLREREVTAAVVFGSVAKGNDTQQSDIDILIVTPRHEDFVREIRRIHAEHGRKISVVNLRTRDLKARLSEPLMGEVIKKHLILRGYEYFVREAVLGCVTHGSSSSVPCGGGGGADAG